MRTYTIVYVDNNFYLSCKEAEKRKTLTKQETINAFNNLFLREIKEIESLSNGIIIRYENFEVKIYSWDIFLNRCIDSAFIEHIIEFEQKLNLKSTNNDKVQRKNKNKGKAVAAIVIAGITGLSSMYALAAHKDNAEGKKNNSTPSYEDTTNISTVEDTTISINNGESTSTIDFSEPTTKEETTTETTTKEETTFVEYTPTGLSGYNYKNDYAGGFIVTTDNKNYQLTPYEFDLMCATVMAEGGSDQDEALAVASVIMNRCDSGCWGGHTVSEVILSPGQFEVIEKGLITPFLNGKVPDSVKDAVRDAAGGIRNNEYQSFRGYAKYSSNHLTSNGNYYR